MAGRVQTRGEIAELREELRQRLAGWSSSLLNLLGIALLAIIVVRFTGDVSPAWARRLNRLSAEIWAIFVLDFAVQFALAPNKRRFLRHNWLLALSVVLPAFRIIHVVRFLITLQGLGVARALAAVNSATRTLGKMLRGHQFGRALLLTAIVTVIGAAGLVYFDGLGGGHYGDALWWSAAFVATVGSNYQPTTIEARILALLLVGWGLGVVGYVTASIATYLVGQQGASDGNAAEQREIALLRQDVAELKAMLAQALAERGDGTASSAGRASDTKPSD